MLGEIGLPGRGFGHGYGSMAETGQAPAAVDLPSVPQGRNPVSSFIPVARVADMLLDPGEPFDYDGQRLTYPDIRLVYWSGGNPFHHHQDLNRLRRAMGRPETIVVHEPFWTGMARHADIVLPNHRFAGTERPRRQPQRSDRDRHAPGGRAECRGAGRFRHLLRCGRPARIRRALSPEQNADGMDPRHVRRMERPGRSHHRREPALLR